MSWRHCELLIAVLIVLFLSAPFDVLKDPFVSGNPSVSPLPIAFALGLLMGALLARSSCPKRRFFQMCRSSNRSMVAITLLVVVLLMSFVARDWASVIYYVEASRSLGFFGSNQYVRLMEFERVFGPWFVGAAGALIVVGYLSQGAFSAGADNEQNNSAVHIADRSALMLIAGFFIRIGSGNIFASSLPIPESAFLNLSFHFAVFAVATFATRTLPGGNHVRGRVLDAVWLALGVITWGALIRVVPLSWFLSGPMPFLAFIAFSLIVAATLLLAWYSRRALTPESNIDLAHGPKGFSVDDLRLTFEQHGLAPRESQIALLYASGSTSGEIATKLSIKPATVRSALQRSYRKLGVEGKESFLTFVKELSSNTAEAGMEEGSSVGEFAFASYRFRAAVFVVALAIGAIIFVPVCISTEKWGAWRELMYATGLSLALIGAAWAVNLDWGKEVDSSVVSHMVLFASLGFSWEELLRATGPFALPNILGPLEVGIVLCIVPPLLNLERLAYRRELGVLAGIAAVSTAMAYTLPIGLYLLALLSSIGLLIESIRSGEVVLSQVGLCIMTFGLSAIAADVIVNRFGDMIWGNDGLTQPYGGRAAFVVLCCVAVGVLTALVLVLVFMASRRLRVIGSACGVSCTPLALKERARHLLLGYGLNDTQASVLLLIAEGKSSSDICCELSCSRGTVNSARREGYLRLSIHDRLGLLRLLSKVDDV